MTTKVRILNEGPQAVQVKIMNTKIGGKLLESKFRDDPVASGAWKDFYVHREQSLEIEEVPHPPVSG